MKKIKLILLVGEGHSGSTLIDSIMDSHSKVTGVGELSHYHKHFLSDELCSCHKQIKKCNFWINVFKDINVSRLRLFYRRGIDFFLNRKKYLCFNIKESVSDIDEYVRLTGLSYENILSFSGKEVVFDSSKYPDRAEAIIRFGDNLDIVLLHLVRDGRGVTYSNIRLGRNSFKFMKKWFVTNLKIEIIKFRNRKVRKLFVQYEDFTENPEKILSYVLDSFDLSFEPDMLKFRNYTHHQSGGNLKVNRIDESDVIKIDNTWKYKMSGKDIVVFNVLFGWLNLFYKLKTKKY